MIELNSIESVRPSGKKDIFILLAIVLASFFILSSILKNNFLSYDDPQWVTQNQTINSFSAEHIHSFFTTPTLNMYAPLVCISFAFDHWIGGTAPFYYHFTNLFLHLLNIILVFLFIRTISKRSEIALIVAALFAFHPAAVDTIAWASTRSNLLYTFFFFASLISYCNYIKGKNKFFNWTLCFLLFTLSCLSKSSAVILPLILLGLDHLHSRSFNLSVILEKLPFLFITFLIGYLAIHFRADISEIRSIPQYNTLDKLFLFSYSLVNYSLKLVVPVGLSAVYTYPAKVNGMLPFIYYLSAMIFPLIAYFLWKLRNSKKELLFGFIFFCICIFPSIIGFLEDGFLANRYAYLPYVGLFFLIGYVVGQLKSKLVPSILLGAGIIYFGFLSYQRTFIWKNDITLFTDVIEKQPDNAFAYNCRGISNYYLNDDDQAMKDYSSAIRVNPVYAEAYENRGILFNALKDFSNALADYDQAIRLNPNSVLSFIGRGIVKMDGLGNYEDAIKDFNEALRIDPTNPQPYFNKGLAELRSGKKEEACTDFAKVKSLGFSQADELIERNCK